MAFKNSAAAGPSQEWRVAADTEPSRSEDAAPEPHPESDPISAELASFTRRLPPPRPLDPAATPIAVARAVPRPLAPSDAPRARAEREMPGAPRPSLPRPAPRFFRLALTFAAGIAAGGVGLYLFQADLPLGIGRLEPRRALAPVASAARAPAIGIDAAGAPATSAGAADTSALAVMFERQLTAGRLDQPDIDNALETYRQIAALAPQDPATTRLGERLAAAFWARANAARAAKRSDDALHDFARLKALPPIPWQMLAAKADDGPAPAAAGSDVAAVFMARGDDALLHGDVMSARQFYERAAASGLARAATAVGLTYDPDFLQARGVRGALADMAAARRWYHKAIDAGDPEARQRLDKLLTPAN